MSLPRVPKELRKLVVESRRRAIEKAIKFRELSKKGVRITYGAAK